MSQTESARTLPPAAGRRIRLSIPALTTLTVDSTVLADVISLKYFVTAWRVGTSAKRLTLNVINEAGTVCDMISSRIGSGPKLSIAASVSGSDIIIEITNPNPGFSIETELIRFKGGI